jgi:hypothetical protein
MTPTPRQLPNVRKRVRTKTPPQVTGEESSEERINQEQPESNAPLKQIKTRVRRRTRPAEREVNQKGPSKRQSPGIADQNADRPKQDDEADDYEVGYGKPPKKYQFKKGQSGNRKGRRKGSRNTSAMLKKALDRMAEVRENGKIKKMPVRELIILKLVTKAVSGDLRALEKVLSMQAADEDAREKNESTDVLAPEDQALLDLFLGGIEKLPKEGSSNDNKGSMNGRGLADA